MFIMKTAKTILDKLKLKTIYKNRDIHIMPEDGKYDSCLIWLHDLGSEAKKFEHIFTKHKLLGVISNW